MIKSLSILFSLFICLSVNAADLTWTGGSGDWNTGGNWSGGSVPTSSDNVSFSGGTQSITLSGDAVCNNLSISCSSGGTTTISIDVGSHTLTISGTTTIDGAGANDTGEIDAGTGSVICKGAVNLGSSSAASGSAVLEADDSSPGSFKFEADVTLGAAARTLPTYEPDFILDPSTSSQTITRSAVTYYFMGHDWTLSATNSPTITFTGAYTYYINCYDGDVTIASNCEVVLPNGGEFEKWIAGGTFTANSSSVVTIAGGTFIGYNNTASTSAFTTIALDAASCVKYTGASQVVRNEPTYGDLVINGSGTHTASGTLDINDDLTLSSTLNAGANTIKIADDLTVNGAYLTAGTSTFEFDGGGASSITRSTALTFNNLTTSGATVLTIGDATTVSGTLTLNGTSKMDMNAAMDLAIVDINASTEFLAGANTHTVSGDWTDDGTLTEELGTINFDGSSNQTISGASANFYDLTHSGTGKVILGANIAVNDDLTTNSGAGAFEAGTSSVGSTYTVGTGTTSTPSRSPFAGLYEDTRKQYIITAAELSALGLSANDVLTSVAWNIKTKATAADFTFDNFTVKLGHTSTSSFPNTTWLTPSFTTCYSGSPVTTSGWNTFTFTSDFTWNGTDNIVVETCFDNGAGDWDDDDIVYYTSTASTVIWAYVDGGSGCTMDDNKSVSSYRPNIRFGTTGVSTGYDINLAGDFDNSATFTHMDGKIICSGSSAQVIKGTSAATFYKFKINNSSGVTITKGPTVENVIEFQSGDITATDASNKFSLGESATIDATLPADAASHVVGYCQVGTAATSEREIPIGDGTAYRPAYVTPQSTSSERYFSYYFSTAHTGVAAKHTDVNNVSSAEYWEVGRVGDNSVNCKIKLTWDGNSSVNEAEISDLAIGHWEDQGSGTKWYREGSAWTTNTTDDWIVTDGYVDNFSPFTLIAKSAAALPIELLSFDATPLGDDVELTWETAVEINNDYFTLEKGQRIGDFRAFHETPGAGNSNEIIGYSAIDFNPYPEGTYYRLKQTDFDGKFSYSNVIYIDGNNTTITKVDISTYPNPAKKGDHVNIQFAGFEENETVLMVLQDVLGRTICSKIVSPTQVNGVAVVIQSTADLAPGAYFITGSSQDKLFSKRLIVE